MVADGLNKGSIGRQALLELGLSGLWNLKHAAVSHAERQHLPITSSDSKPSLFASVHWWTDELVGLASHFLGSL